MGKKRSIVKAVPPESDRAVGIKLNVEP